MPTIYSSLVTRTGPGLGGEVGLAARLGQPVARTRPEDVLHRLVERHEVADRDVDRGDAVLGAQGRADDLVAVDEGLARTALVRQRRVVAAQDRLGAAERGDAGGEPEVAGQ